MDRAHFVAYFFLIVVVAIWIGGVFVMPEKEAEASQYDGNRMERPDKVIADAIKGQTKVLRDIYSELTKIRKSLQKIERAK